MQALRGTDWGTNATLPRRGAVDQWRRTRRPAPSLRRWPDTWLPRSRRRLHRRCAPGGAAQRAQACYRGEAVAGPMSPSRAILRPAERDRDRTTAGVATMALTTNDEAASSMASRRTGIQLGVQVIRAMRIPTCLVHLRQPSPYVGMGPVDQRFPRHRVEHSEAAATLTHLPDRLEQSADYSETLRRLRCHMQFRVDYGAVPRVD